MTKFLRKRLISVEIYTKNTHFSTKDIQIHQMVTKNTHFQKNDVIFANSAKMTHASHG